MKASSLILSAACAALVATTGCIHTEETLSKLPGSGSRQESSSEVEIPLVFEHKTRTVRGPDTVFNGAVARADTNRDGKITETEARIFAGQVK